MATILSRACRTRPVSVSPAIYEGAVFEARPSRRYLATTPQPNIQETPAAESSQPTTPPSRLVSSLRTRIGKCILFGLTPSQSQSAGDICSSLNTNWRELTLGPKGFMTSKHRTGMWRRKVDWGEMDSMGHVNNVVYNKWVEAARVNWALNFAQQIDPENAQGWRELVGPRGIGLILKNIKTEFKFPMVFPDRVTVLHKLLNDQGGQFGGQSSFGLEVVVLSEKHQRVAAKCSEENVVYDYRAGKRTDLPPFMIRAFEALYKEQEMSQRECVRLVGELEGRVRELEKGSWDKADAVEMTGP